MQETVASNRLNARMPGLVSPDLLHFIPRPAGGAKEYRAQLTRAAVNGERPAPEEDRPFA